MDLLMLLISTTLLFSTYVANATDGNNASKLWGEPVEINGNVYLDIDNGTTLSQNDIGIEDIAVEAFRDVNTNGVLDEEDYKVGTTKTNNDGGYRLTVNPNNMANTSTKISSSTDDAVQNEPGGIMVLDGASESGIREIGLRFANVDVPQGAKITSASLKITMANDSEDFIEIIVKGEATDNSTTFITEEYNIWNRPRTTMTNAWYSSIERKDSVEVEVDGIQAIVQEVIDRDGWSNGNALTLIIADFNCDMYMFDGGFPAELIINYEIEDLTEAAYIIAPLFENVDPTYELYSDAFPLVLISEETTEINNINFGFSMKTITANEVNTIDLNETSLQVFPTITNAEINVSLTTTQPTQDYSIQIYNLNGQLLTQEKLDINNKRPSQHDLSRFSKGTYIVQVSDGTNSFTKKVILQ